MPDCRASTVFLPIDPGRPGQLHLEQLSGPAGQGVDGYFDAGGKRPADELAARADGIEVGRRAEVHDDRGAAEQMHRGQRVHDAVTADFLGIVHPDRDTGLHARLDDHGGHVAVVALAHLPHLVQHGRHRRAEGDAGDSAIRQPVGRSQRAVSLKTALCASRPRSTTAISSAVRSGTVAIRQCSITSGPSKMPSTVFVLPTSIASSIGVPLSACPTVPGSDELSQMNSIATLSIRRVPPTRAAIARIAVPV